VQIQRQKLERLLTIQFNGAGFGRSSRDEAPFFISGDRGQTGQYWPLIIQIRIRPPRRKTIKGTGIPNHFNQFRITPEISKSNPTTRLYRYNTEPSIITRVERSCLRRPFSLQVIIILFYKYLKIKINLNKNGFPLYRYILSLGRSTQQ